MEAGRELDALVMKHILTDWKYYKSSFEQYQPSTWTHADGRTWRDGNFSPSTDIAAAWEVVEKMVRDRSSIDEFEGPLFCGKGSYTGESTLRDETWFVRLTDRRSNISELIEAGTAPLAICLAALKTKGVEV